MRFEVPAAQQFERLQRPGSMGHLAEQGEQLGVVEFAVEGVEDPGLEGEEGARAAHALGEVEVVAQGAQALPRAFAGGQLELLAAGAEPAGDGGQAEQRARRRAADGRREVRVATAPVAHRGPADPGEPRDVGRADRGVVVHGGHSIGGCSIQPDCL
jgi:hypothetical protein